MSYTVGQVIYIVLNKEARVYPMQIVEEITKKTLEGEVVTYMVRGGAEAAAVVSISQVNGEIFDSIDEASEALKARAIASINKLIAAARQKAEEWYPNAVAVNKSVDSAFMDVPTPSLPKAKAKKKFDPVAELQNDLQKEANSPALEEDSVMMLPDGTKVKVASIKLPDSVQ